MEGEAIDVCVYGGTASGVMAALSAAREGAKVVLVEPSRWLGGMTGGGIHELDWGHEGAVGGTTARFLTDGNETKPRPTGKDVAAHIRASRAGLGNKVYRERFKQILAEASVQVIHDHRLGGVKLDGKVIRAISLDHAPVDKTGCPIPEPMRKDALGIRAKVFIDCSYEGDLMAMSGVAYTWGRESREQYGESLAGVRPSLWVYDIDPYKEPGNPESGLIAHVQDIPIGPLGSADKLTMAYGFRFEFDREGGGIPFPEPETYDPSEFEMYRRAMKNGVDIYANRQMNRLGQVGEWKRPPFIGSPNLSRSLWSPVVFGSNQAYPDGDWATRARIWKFHQQFFLRRLHFVRTDPVVPQELKEQIKTLGFKRGVFDETGGWPHQLYVREARRMVSDRVITQRDLEGLVNHPHPVGLASYGVDDWPYATVVENGKIALQGGEFSVLHLDEGRFGGVYQVPYESLVPKRGDCENLLVPVCLSASHIAMTSTRMEPVWMVLGESAGVAAAMAVERKLPVQDVPYDRLRARLSALGQKLDRDACR